jgi:cytochrome c oxidase subunit IV
MAIDTNLSPEEASKATIRKVWKTAGILAAITAVEFVVAFMPGIPRTLKVVTFVLLTIVKAAYIVGEFMHLKYEAKTLLWSIVLPMTFIVWLLVALLVEGESILGGI